MTSQLPHFWSLFLSYQQQKNIENGAALTSLRSFLFRDDFNKGHGFSAASLMAADKPCPLQPSLGTRV